MSESHFLQGRKKTADFSFTMLDELLSCMRTGLLEVYQMLEFNVCIHVCELIVILPFRFPNKAGRFPLCPGCCIGS